MKRPTWFKFHALAPADPKVCLLSSDTVRWSWVVCLCSAKMQENQGKWVNRYHLMAAAHVSESVVDELVAAELLDESDDGISIHGWKNWQCDDDKNAERSAKYRERTPSARRAHAERTRERKTTRGE